MSAACTECGEVARYLLNGQCLDCRSELRKRYLDREEAARKAREALPLDLVESLYKWREAMRSTAGEFVQPAPSIVTDAMQRWVRATGEKP